MQRTCPSCGRPVPPGMYLCRTDWSFLSAETKRRLYLKDARSLERYLVLTDQLDNHVPLRCVVVPA